MANVRDSDTALWLHNKLGTSNDSWTGGSICSQLNAEVLRNIKDCFPDLQTQVKVKLLLSFFQITRRNVVEWRPELEEILEVAQLDSEQWISMLGEMMKTFPSTGCLNAEITEVEENRRIFADLVNDLKKLAKKQNDPSMAMLPLECHFLNKNVLTTVVGNQPPLTKHFTLKRKPKSAALRVELLQKSVDAANNLKKCVVPTIPVRSRGMPRKLTDTTPLKGIPSRVPFGGFRSTNFTAPSASVSRAALPRPPVGRKDGGIKLLEITEQPLGYAQAKKRKKMMEIEEANKKAAAAEAAQQANATPDYAAGLISSNPPTPAPPSPPAARPSAASVPANTVSMPILNTGPPLPSLSVGSHHVPATQENLLLASGVPPSQGYNGGVITPTAAPTIVKSEKVEPGTTDSTVKHIIHVKPVADMTQVKTVTQDASNQPATFINKRGLSLTREQMLEAQKMFRSANQVTRPEKALILGFMAGSRENPCPNRGSIVTIKLSENQENVLQPDDTYTPMMAETYFQMNYNTGEWKRIKKFRKIDDSVQNIVNQHTSTNQVPV